MALLDRLDASLTELDRAVAKEAEQRRAACCLMEQPGVGPVTALMFVLTIGPVQRFARSKQVVSYLGVNPRESSSGGRQRLGAISKQGNSMARFLLVEAAQTASRYDEELRRDYQRLKFRRGTAVAKVAIARKLAVRLYWKLHGRPMGDDSILRDRVAKAFQEQFPGIRSNESQPDMVVFFTVVDYVPGCLPNCKKFKTYRNWTCEVEIFAVESDSKPETFVFNLDGSTYNPLHNPAANCASELTKTFRGLNSIPNS